MRSANLPQTIDATRAMPPSAASTAVAVIMCVYFFTAFYFPRVIADFTNVRSVLMLGGALGIALVARRLSVAARILVLVLIILWVLLVTAVASHASTAVGDPLILTNCQRLFVVTPMFVILGMLCSRRPRLIQRMFAQFAIMSSVVAIFAFMEYRAQHSIIGQEQLFLAMARDGQFRAVLASDHALVLGALFAVAVGCCTVLSARWKIICLPLLLLGTYSTGSRGPLVIAAVLAAVSIFPRASSILRRVGHLPLALASCTLVAVGYLSLNVWTTTVLGATGAEYSTNYRYALYASLPNILRTVPFGYGFASLPLGQWLINSQLFGVNDLVTTLDSEFVYSAISLGWIGLLVVIFIFLVSVRMLEVDYQVGLPLFALTASGFFLALHAWDSLGSLWPLLTGLCLGCLAIRASKLKRGATAHQLLERVNSCGGVE